MKIKILSKESIFTDKKGFQSTAFEAEVDGEKRNCICYFDKKEIIDAAIKAGGELEVSGVTPNEKQKGQYIVALIKAPWSGGVGGGMKKKPSGPIIEQDAFRQYFVGAIDKYGASIMNMLVSQTGLKLGEMTDDLRKSVCEMAVKSACQETIQSSPVVKIKGAFYPKPEQPKVEASPQPKQEVKVDEDVIGKTRAKIATLSPSTDKEAVENLKAKIQGSSKIKEEDKTTLIAEINAKTKE